MCGHVVGADDSVGPVDPVRPWSEGSQMPLGYIGPYKVWGKPQSTVVGVDAHIDPFNLRQSSVRRWADVGIGPYKV